MALTVIVFGACGSAASVTRLVDLHVGECYDSGGTTGPTVSMLPTEGVPEVLVTRVPCAQPHTFEVFGLASDPADPDTAYPGDQIVFDRSDGACSALFESYVGSDYDASPLYVRVLTPDKAQWDEGARGFVCSLFDPNDSRLIGSQRGDS